MFATYLHVLLPGDVTCQGMQHVNPLANVTCQGMQGKSDFKLYKFKIKSKNHETWRHVVLSHVEDVVKNS